jgi:biotin carboxyl carrier protein
MKKFKFTIRGNDYEVNIDKFENNIAEIEVNGTSYTVELHSDVKTSKTPKLVRSVVPPPTRKEQKLTKNISAKSNSVKSPLPGTILKILIKEGQEVKKGDNLMIMEAMKMENNILSEKDGVISSIKVKEGDTVLQNDVLIEIA